MQDDSEVLRFVFADCLVARASKRQTALSTARAKSVRFGIFSLIDYLFRNHEPWVQVVNETELPLMYRYPSCLTSLNAWPMFQIPPNSRMAISVIIGKQNAPLFWISLWTCATFPIHFHFWITNRVNTKNAFQNEFTTSTKWTFLSGMLIFMFSHRAIASKCSHYLSSQVPSLTICIELFFVRFALNSLHVQWCRRQ